MSLYHYSHDSFTFSFSCLCIIFTPMQHDLTMHAYPLSCTRLVPTQLVLSAPSKTLRRPLTVIESSFVRRTTNVSTMSASNMLTHSWNSRYLRWNSMWHYFEHKTTVKKFPSAIVTRILACLFATHLNIVVYYCMCLTILSFKASLQPVALIRTS